MDQIKCWLGSFVIFQGIRASIAKKPYISVIFQWGSGLPFPPLDPLELKHIHVCGRTATPLSVRGKKHYRMVWLIWAPAQKIVTVVC